jgi:YbbR domain-containing protein
VFLSELLKDWPAKIISLIAAVLLFMFNRMNNLEEHPLLIPLSIKINDEFAIATPIKQKISVILRGDTDFDIRQITPDDIELYIDLLNTTKEGEYTVPVQYRKISPVLDVEPLEIVVEPSVMTVMVERNMRKYVDIEVENSIKGKPARGYTMVSYTFNPTSVQITGPRSRVELADKAKAEPIDLSGKKKSFTIDVRLVPIDPLVKYRDGQSIEFSAVIEEEIEEKTIDDITIASRFLPQTMAIGSQLPKGSITVKAPVVVLDKLDLNDIILYIDCTNLKNPGRQQKRIKTEIPEGIEILKVEPEIVNVDFIRKK